jgi:aerobic-type carbon monoxide dehydrogenase small subunit (CoxS/CutS family)
LSDAASDARIVAKVIPMATQLIVNGKPLSTADDPSTPLLWVLRDTFGLTGTKFGCGIAQCGACTVMVDGEAVRSCVTPVARVAGKRITTVEGLSTDNSHPVQRAWAAEQVAQCGYCQPGQIMSATALLSVNRNPSDADIDNALSGNVCRCGTYVRIRRAIHRAAEEMRGGGR